MSQGVKDIFILAGLVALYGVAIWIYERKDQIAWSDSYSLDPSAIFARDHDRDRRIAEELNADSFTPPADEMTVLPIDGGDSDAGS